MTFNSDLAHEALVQIRAHPESHYQEDWRCGSGMCFAGWVAHIDGVRWYTEDPDSYANSYVVVDPDKVREDFRKRMFWINEQRTFVASGKDPNEGLEPELHHDVDKLTPVMHASEYARMVLGLDAEESWVLFAGDNTVSDLEAFVKVLENNDNEDRLKALYEEHDRIDKEGEADDDDEDR